MIMKRKIMIMVDNAKMGRHTNVVATLGHVSLSSSGRKRRKKIE